MKVLPAAQPDDVSRSILLLLGVRCLDEAMIERWRRASLAESLTAIIASPDFAAFATAVLQHSTLPHQRRLNDGDRRAVARWLDQWLPDSRDLDGAGWWTLLSNVLGRDPWRAAAAALPHGQAFLDLLAAHAALERIRAEGEALVYGFDDGYFSRLLKGLGLSSLAEASQDDRRLVETVLGRALPLLPAFSEGLDGIVQDLGPGASFAAVLARMRQAAQGGKLGHWLFDAAYFDRHCDLTPSTRQAYLRLAGGSAYLAFLYFGDRARLPPHPLFSYYVYGGHATDGPTARRPFLHYLTRGLFDGLPTSAVFDADYYAAANPLVRHDLAEGTHVNGLHHFLRLGIGAGLTFSPDFDADFYVTRYPDIAEAAAARLIPSPHWHFVFFGLNENRQPNPYFDPAYYADRYPGAIAESASLGVASLLEHFLLLGRVRGYRGSRPLVSIAPDMKTGKAIYERRARRAACDLLARGLDLRPSAEREIAVSLVVPLCNAYEFTALLLQQAYFAAVHLEACGGVAAQVILVDNGSTDQTQRLLARVSGVTVLTYPEPIGFPRAVNAGAAVARGAVIIIANNDIGFAPDAFADVLDLLRREPQCGAVGGKVVLPNETLQEFGAFVGADGETAGYGRNEAPWADRFARPIAADYASGCFLGLRRCDFEAVGGLDEAFGTGYYEDVDLCFRLKQRLGLSTLIDPKLVITHYEHASFARGRPIHTSLAAIARNRAVLKQRHAGALAQKPAGSEFTEAAGVRPGAVGRARILVITDHIPDRRIDARSARSQAVVRALVALGQDVDLFAAGPHRSIDDYAEPGTDLFRGWMAGEDLRSIVEQRGSLYSHVWIFGAHLLARFSEDLAPLVDRWGGRIVLDIEALDLGDDAAPDAVAPVEPAEAPQPWPAALQHGRKADLYVALSHPASARLQSAGASACVIGYPDEPPRPSPSPSPERRRRMLLLCPGRAAEAADLAVLDWFAARVMPRLDAGAGPPTLTLAGAWRQGAAAEAVTRRVETTAGIDVVEVEAPEAALACEADCLCGIAPDRFTVDLAAEALHLMRLGVPVLMGERLARHCGLDALQEGGLPAGAWADEGEAMAAAIAGLAADPEVRQRLQARQREVASRLSGEAGFAAGVKAALGWVLAGVAGPSATT